MNPEIRILVVEDDRNWLELICRMFEEIFPSANVIPASIGRDTLKWLDKEKYDLISVDINLDSAHCADISIPGVNGYDIICKASEKKACKGVIVISGALTDKKLPLVLPDEGIRKLVEEDLNVFLEKLFPGDRHIFLPKMIGVTDQRNIKFFKTNLSREKLLNWFNAVNEFYLAGEKWVVTFNNNTFYLTDLKPTRFIHYLLSHQNKEIPFTELYRSFGGKDENSSQVKQNIGNSSEDSSDGMTVKGASNGNYLKMNDRKTVLFYKGRLEVIDDEIAEANADGNCEQKENLIKEKKDYQEFLNKNPGTAIESMRTTVSHAITRIENEIKIHNLPLYEHLKSYLQRGNIYSYRPYPPNIEWRTQK